jgi:hypothetical protein
LARAWEIDPTATNLPSLLAEAHYRADDFAAAARYFRLVNRTAKAAKLDALAAAPYVLERPEATVVLPWIRDEPVAVVEVAINGSPANLVVDTGAGELILDTEFAGSNGVGFGGAEEGWFAGGRSAVVRHGRLDALRLGEQGIGNLPVELMELTPLFAAHFPDPPIHGILGSVVLYHFLPTLDFSAHRLVLRPRRKREVAGVGAEAPGAPCWLAGDHFILVETRVNRLHRTLMALDTGMSGAELAVPVSTLRLAGLATTAARPEQGQGGGGAVPALPVMADSLAIEGLSRQGVKGMLLPGFPIEHQFGFRVGGLLARDFLRASTVTLDFARMRLQVTAH